MLLKGSTLLPFQKKIGELSQKPRKLGHINVQKMKLMQANNYVKSLKLKSSLKITFCTSYAYGKEIGNKFSTSKGQKANFMLLDVCRLMQIKMHNSFKYFLTFIDDSSIKSYVYFMEYKSEVFEYFKIYKVKAKTFLKGNF
jgi:hypothetical protein